MWSIGYSQVPENETVTSSDKTQNLTEKILPLPVPILDEQTKVKSFSGDDSDNENVNYLEDSHNSQEKTDEDANKLETTGEENDTKNQSHSSEMDEDFVIVDSNQFAEKQTENLTLKPSKI